MPYIYKISQDEDNRYDTFDSAVVVANSSAEAAKIHPVLRSSHYDKNTVWEYGSGAYGWVDSPDKVKVEIIGETVFPHAKAGTVIVASFNAG